MTSTQCNGVAKSWVSEWIFALDCETPHHQTWLAPHAPGSRWVTNAEWREFIRDSGYPHQRWQYTGVRLAKEL